MTDRNHRNARGNARPRGNEKMKGMVERARGRAKETVGRAVGNRRMTAAGRAERGKGSLRQAKEKIKDAFRR